MVKVCDAIMGTGKSSAAITYMNEHKDRRFIYVTPYLDEAARIAEACEMHFYKPQKTTENHGSKIRHTEDLVEQNKNIATTHQAFKYYPPELIDLIREKQYIIIIDECLDVLDQLNHSSGDIDVLEEAGYLEECESSVYRVVKDTYTGSNYRDLFRIAKSRNIVRLEDKGKNGLYYWQIPKELFDAADEVFVLTYLFRGQSIRYFLDINEIPYQHIWVEKTPDGVYRFSDTVRYIPEYVSHIKEMIHLVDDTVKTNINNIGEDNFALSLSWFKDYRNAEKFEQLKRNLSNYYQHFCPCPKEERVWGTFEKGMSKLRGRGYSKAFLVFNQKSTNKYRHKTGAAYCANVFMHVGQKIFYEDHGADVDEDAYALSIMLQWIWRTAIRDGKEIWLYVPSKRMRTLLLDWMDEITAEANDNAAAYQLKEGA